MLLYKLYELANDYGLDMIRVLLSNRCFQFSFQEKKSRRRDQKNAFPQSSVLASTLFNRYRNNQPSFIQDCKHFIYADDQHHTFEEVENTLMTGFTSMGEYNKQKQLKPNPSKTQIEHPTCAITRLIES